MGSLLYFSAFLKDENNIPAEYILQPISYKYPNYCAKDKDVSKAAYSQWGK
jgi:hypothetical protein